MDKNKQELNEKKEDKTVTLLLQQGLSQHAYKLSPEDAKTVGDILAKRHYWFAIVEEK